MMWRKLLIAVIGVVLVLLLTPALTADAQNTGSIRGIVYNDLNADGFCVGTGEPGQSGVPVEFVFTGSGLSIPLQTGVDGSFGVVSITLGTWEVTVKPPTGWRATSAQTRQVTLTATQPTVSGIDFCLTQAPAGGGGTSPPVLPESGAGLASNLIAASAVGVFLLALGAALIHRGRRAVDHQ